MHSKKLLVLAAVVAVATPVAGYAAVERTAARAPARIVIDDGAFKPKIKVVRRGQRLVWQNRDHGIHSVAAVKKVGPRRQPIFETAAGGRGATLTARAPRKKGRYAYLCEVHRTMKGTLVDR